MFCGPDGAGFDAVIGNPPYEVLSELESGIDPTDLKTFVAAVPAFRPAIRGKHNLYKPFICRALDVLRDGGRLGFIVPMPLLGDDQAAGLRKYLAAAGGFTAIDAFPQKDDATRRVFADANLSTVVFAYRKDPAAAAARFPCRFHPADAVAEAPAGELHPTTAVPDLARPSGHPRPAQLGSTRLVFRLGSTNSKVNEYQFNNLPCPRFRESATPGEEATGRAAVAALEAGQPAVAELAAEPLLADAPFSPVVQAVIAAAVDRIAAAESGRGSIARTARSALSAAQPYQDFLAHVYFRLAGLTAAEVAGLRTRYEAMRKLK